MVETLISQMKSSTKSDKAKEAMDAHMGSLQQQMRRGVQDLFRHAERARSSTESRSGIRSYSFPFKLKEVRGVHDDSQATSSCREKDG